MSVRQQSIPAAFEIRFTDASVEVHEIAHDPIPEPFKKRDKIPRNSGSFVSPERLSGADAQSQPTTQKWSKRHFGEKPINTPQKNGIFPGQKGRQNVINRKFNDNNSVDENTVITDAQKEKLSHISTPKRLSRSKRTHSSSESLSDHQVVPNNKIPKRKSNTSTKAMSKTQPLSSPRRYSSDSKLRPTSGLSTPPTTPPPTPPNNATVPDNRTSIDTSAPSTPPSFLPTPKPRLNLSTSPPIITPFSVELSESPVEEYPPPSITPTIPHDEVIIPTVAKKLRKTRQYSETGYTDVTDQVENLFSNPSSPRPNARRQGSSPTTRRRPNSRYKSGSGRQSSYEVRTDIHRVPYNNHGRDQEYEKAEDNVSFTMYKPVDNEKVVDESDSEANRLRKGRRARREEWVMVVRDEDEESAEQTSQTDMAQWYDTPASTELPGTGTSNGNEKDVNADMVRIYVLLRPILMVEYANSRPVHLSTT
ncbi:6027_t:CDS:2 [Paraglomus brasilianum]|uniref:6027_t:CDS:1 n=1 Tax=Paraglomus brasilianum TaxID=144538 RepID=A0A9N9AQ49_9GLOM|nr:6027_t:CDS:2 [Paraglomus brasilianum]